MQHTKPSHHSVDKTPGSRVDSILDIESDQDTQVSVLDHPLGCLYCERYRFNSIARSRPLAEPELVRGQSSRDAEPHVVEPEALQDLPYAIEEGY